MSTTTAAENRPPQHGAVFQPVASGERISSLDTLRGVALLGILLMNITGFALPHAYDNPTIYGGAEGPNLFVWAMNNMFFEGTMRGIFSMLFGAGVILLTSRAEARGAHARIADIYYRRTIWLILFGVIHGFFLLWPGEILYYYGMVGLFLFPFRKMATRGLIITGIVLLLVSVPMNIFWYQHAAQLQADAPALQALVDEGEELDREQQEKLDEWDEMVESGHPPAEELEKEIEEMNSGYAGAFGVVAPEVIEGQSTGPYFWANWDIGGMMILGMALMKLGVFTASRGYGFYLLMLVLGYGIGLPVNLYETRALIDSNFDMMVLAQSWITYDLGRLPTTFGHIGLIMIICKADLLGWLRAALAAVGRTALSNYVLHTVLCVFIFSGVGLGMYGALQRHQLYFVVAAIYMVNLTISPIWLRHYRFGPLEWMWRSLTYWKKQPMKKAVPVIEPAVA